VKPRCHSMHLQCTTGIDSRNRLTAITLWFHHLLYCFFLIQVLYWRLTISSCKISFRSTGRCIMIIFVSNRVSPGFSRLFSGECFLSSMSIDERDSMCNMRHYRCNWQFTQSFRSTSRQWTALGLQMICGYFSLFISHEALQLAALSVMTWRICWGPTFQ